jgi:hypothetical protein
VFAYEPQEKEEADAALARHNLWPELDRLLQEVTVCDPACGSGSFLVGMLLVLDDLQARANTQLGREETPYERRRRIVGQSLYGVDAMEWAVHVAELRLWLQLVVETEVSPAERHLRPLLPHLSFKVRPGDSLVQEIGGINFGLHQAHLDLPRELKGKLTQLTGKKLRFYQGQTAGLSEDALKHEEFLLFREILAHKQHALQEEIKRLDRGLATLPAQYSFSGGAPTLSPETTRHREALRQEKADKAAQLARVQRAYAALQTAASIPFVWNIAFVEIFEGKKGGFDIVIGNPPYVRQEKIAPADLQEEDYAPDAWRRLKEAYKAKLQESVVAAHPRFFQNRRPNARSDLYVYFYFHGLSLLNEQGAFCFITSNSWLDVEYGKDLQEFLLTHSHVKLVLDNHAKRSFRQADVNTVIVLLAPPRLRPWSEARLTELSARFVACKVPFEEVLSPVIFQEIDEAAGRVSRPEFRVAVLSHQELYQQGLALPEEEEQAPPTVATRGLMRKAAYQGNKWGGKYLRAPDIFFTILEKGKGKLVRLGDIAEVRFGIKTGANEFFYLEPVGVTVAEVAAVAERDPMAPVPVRNGAGWEGQIETGWLRPVIKSPREIKTLRVRLEDLRYLVFMPPEDIRKAIDQGRQPPLSRYPKAAAYIRWGEEQDYPDRPTCASRQWWWDVGEQDRQDIILLRFRDQRNWTPMVDGKLAIGDVVFVGRYRDPGEALVLNALLNSTSHILTTEVLGRINLGEGLLTTYGPEIVEFLSLDPKASDSERYQRLLSAFVQMAQRPVRSIFEELGLPLCGQRRCGHPEHPYEHVDPQALTLDQVRQTSPDRYALDTVVFDVLGLTESERLEVYRAVVQLVKDRLEKARSV